MEPLTIAGALAGAVLNKVLPDTVLAVLLVLLLSVTANESLGKARKMHAKETREINARSLSFSSTQAKEAQMIRRAQSTVSSLAPVARSTSADFSSSSDDDDEEDLEPAAPSTSLLSPAERTADATTDYRTFDAELQAILEEEKTPPLSKVAALACMFAVVLFINVLKGGGGFSPLGIACGSFGFWAANLSMVVWICGFSVCVRNYLVRRYEVKARVNYLYVEGDIRWSPRNTLVYPSICALAGFFAGMFGVGGGIVKGPLMLAMDVHPAVSAATSATMILFTSFTAATSFAVFGLLVPSYAAVCLTVGFCATYAGQLTLAHFMKKNDRNSYIAFSIGGVVLLSAVLMGGQALVSVAAGGGTHHGGGMCGKDE